MRVRRSVSARRRYLSPNLAAWERAGVYVRVRKARAQRGNGPGRRGTGADSTAALLVASVGESRERMSQVGEGRGEGLPYVCNRSSTD